MRHARLVGAGLALCMGAALAASRPRWLRPVGWTVGLFAMAAMCPPLRLGRLAARWGVAGYYAALGALFLCAGAALGAALSLLPIPRGRQSSRSRP